MPPFDLPDIPLDSYSQYVADRFKQLTQPVIDAFGTQRDPAIQAVYDKVDPANRLYVDQAVGAAQRAGINPVEYVNHIWQTSGFNPDAANGPGKGIAQLNTQQAQGFGINPTNASQSIDAGARSLAQSQAAGQVDSSSHQAFVTSLAPLAQRWEQATGIPASTWLAMAASESNWGKAGNALFGIKGQGTAGGLTSPTWESVNGQRVNITDTFRNYNNPNEAFQGFWNFVHDNPRYAGALQQLQQGNPQGFVQALNQAGYATDPHWHQAIESIAQQQINPMLGLAPTAGGNSVSTTNSQAPTAPLAAPLARDSYLAQPATSAPQAPLSFKSFSDGLLHQFSQGLGINANAGGGVPQQDGRLSSMVENGSTNQQSSPQSFTDWSNGLIQHFGQAVSFSPTPAPSSPSGESTLSTPGYNDMAGASSSFTAPPATSSGSGGQQGDINRTVLGQNRTNADSAAPSFADWSSGLINQFGRTVGLSGGQSASSEVPGASGGTSGPSYNDMVGASSSPSSSPAPTGDNGGGIVGTALGAVGSVLHELPRARQLVDLGLPNPSGPSGSPGQKLDYYLSKTDPKLPFNVRFGQAMDLAQADQDKTFATGAKMDPTEGVATGLAQTATHLMDPTQLVAPELGAPATAGLGAGVAGGLAYSRATGASPAETAANMETGGTLGMGAGLIGHALAPALPKVAQAAGQALRAPYDLGVRPGLSVADASTMGSGGAAMNGGRTVYKGMGRALGQEGGVPKPNDLGVIFATTDQPTAMKYGDWRGSDAGVLPFQEAAGAKIADVTDESVVRRILDKMATLYPSKWHAASQWDRTTVQNPEWRAAVASEIAANDEGWGELGMMDEPSIVKAVKSLGYDGVTDGVHVAYVNPKVLAPAPTTDIPPPASDVTRMYHGTGSAFDTPDGAKFDPNGLFGPGYYLTSDPRVASSYALNRTTSLRDRLTLSDAQDVVADILRQIPQATLDPREFVGMTREDVGSTLNSALYSTGAGLKRINGVVQDVLQAPGSNVRAVNVPKGLNLLNADAPVAWNDVTRITDLVQKRLGTNDAATFENTLPQGKITGADVWEALNPTGESDPRLASSILRDAGYDGITYNGGKRIPLMDEAGQPIEHQATVIFPESLPKIRNAISGTTMGSPPAIGGGVLGAAYGATQGNTPEERAKNAALYGGLGLGGAFAAERIAGLPGVRNILGDLPASTRHAINELVAPAKNTGPQAQDALRTFAGRLEQAGVASDTTVRQGERALGTQDRFAPGSLYEHTGQFMPTPTAAQADLARNFHDFVTATGPLGVAHGYISGDVVAAGKVNNYFPHITAASVTQTGPRNVSTQTLSPKDFFSQGRVHPDLATGAANGVQYVDSTSGPMGHYTLHVLTSEAKYQLVQDLKNANPTVAMAYRPGDKLPDGWVPGDRIDRQFAPKPIALPNPTNSTALGQVAYTPGTAFAPDVAQALQNVLHSSALRSTAVGRMLTGALGEAKQTLFSLSQFHTGTLLRQAYRANDPVGAMRVIAHTVDNMLRPGAFDSWRLNPDTIQTMNEAAGNGVTGLIGSSSADLGGTVKNPVAAGLIRAGSGALSGYAAGYGSAKLAGEDEGTAQQRGAIFAALGAVAGPTLGKILTDSLWERAVPTLKTLTYQIAKASTGDGKAAANFVNQTYGGNNLAAIARNPTMQDVTRLAVMAPDWWEGWARQVGSAFTGGAGGNLARAYWLRTAAIDGTVMLEGLNYALNGHFTDRNDPGKQFALETTGLYDRMGWDRKSSLTGMPERTYVDILGPIASMLNAAQPMVTGAATGGVRGAVGGAVQGAAAFAKAHEGLVPATFSAVNSGVDYRGKPIASPGADALTSAAQTAGYAVSQVAPIGVTGAGQNTSKEPLPISALSVATGLRTSRAEGMPRAALSQPSDRFDAFTKRYGIYYAPTPLGRNIQGVPLTQQEEDAYNQLLTKNLDYIVAALDKPTFAQQTATDRQRNFNRDLTRIQTSTASQILATIPQAERKARLANKNAVAPAIAP